MSHGVRHVRLDRLAPEQAEATLRRLQRGGVLVAVLGLAGTALLAGGDRAQFFFSWLVAFMYFLSIALGALFFVLVHHATKAGWGVAVRRVAENLMSVLPAFIVLSLPVLLGVHDLFHWSHEEAVAHDVLLQRKQGYLNVEFFYVRAAIYLAAWTALAWWFGSTSVRQDSSGDPALSRRMIAVSGPALMVFAATVTFAAFDWIMSLDPHWYSTIFGVYYFAGCLIGAFALTAILASRLSRSGPLHDVITVDHFHDLGKLLYAFTVFWAYIGFSQYFLIWYANIPEETAWYLHRSHGGWGTVTLVLALGHFVVPFFLLMSRHVKRGGTSLVLGAVWMLLMHLVDLYWLIMPNHHKHGVHLSPLDLTTLAAVGGVFLAVFAWVARRRALVPIRDPRLAESLSFENV